MSRLRTAFIALGLLLLSSFGGVLIWSLVIQPGNAQDGGDNGTLGPDERTDQESAETLEEWLRNAGEFGGETDAGEYDRWLYTKGGKFREYPQAWCEAIFIQIDTAQLAEISVGGEPLVTPVSEKSVLTAQQKADLLRELKSKPSCRVISSASVITVGGQQALLQMVEEVRYSVESEPRRTQEPAFVPDDVVTHCSGYWGTFQEWEAGMRLNVTPTMPSEGDVITLVLLPEVSRLVGWKDLGSGLGEQPFFRSWSAITSVHCPDGMTLMMTGTPTSAFDAPFDPDQQMPAVTSGKTAILLISARTLDVPLTEEAEAEQ